MGGGVWIGSGPSRCGRSRAPGGFRSRTAQEQKLHLCTTHRTSPNASPCLAYTHMHARTLKPHTLSLSAPLPGCHAAMSFVAKPHHTAGVPWAPKLPPLRPLLPLAPLLPLLLAPSPFARVRENTGAPATSERWATTEGVAASASGCIGACSRCGMEGRRDRNWLSQGRMRWCMGMPRAHAQWHDKTCNQK